MKKADFSDELHEVLNTYTVDISYLRKYYKDTIETLNLARKTAQKIKNPRHMGDYLEDTLFSLLRAIVPQKYAIAKGYIINESSAISKEQDLIIYDTSLGAPLYRTEKIEYIPAEAALASIEVKSDLKLSELRKSIINCVSAKKLLHQDFDFKDSEEKRHFYCIFAYSSSPLKKNFFKELNSLVSDIPESLRPNLIFILNLGLYLPTTGGEIQMGLSDIQQCDEPYKLFENQKCRDLDVQIFLLYFGLIIEHCFHQSQHRKPVNYIQYVIRPVIWQQRIEENGSNALAKSTMKYVNKNQSLQLPNGGKALPSYTEDCPDCGIQYRFYAPPVTSKGNLERMNSSFATEGILQLPKTMLHRCTCGKQFRIQEK